MRSGVSSSPLGRVVRHRSLADWVRVVKASIQALAFSAGTRREGRRSALPIPSPRTYLSSLPFLLLSAQEV